MVSVLLSTRRISSRGFFFSFGLTTRSLIISLMFIIILSLISHNPTTTTTHQDYFLFVDSFSASYQSSSSSSLSLSSQRTTLHRKHQQQQQQQQNHYYFQGQGQLPKIRQKQQRRRIATTTTTLYAAIPLNSDAIPLNSDNAYDLEDGVRTSASESESESESPAFIIETLSKTPPSSDEIFRTISDLCIDVFFKELLDPSGNGNINFVKELQIGYLKNLQAADLRRRRERFKDTNEMFLAYEVKRVTGTSTAILSQPLLLDDELKNDVYNLNNKKRKIRDDDFSNDNDDCYVRGDLLGFVEITQRPYGLGSSSIAVESSSSSEEEEIVTAYEYSTSLSGNDRPMRPVLTNLAVLKGARRSGIGSKLVDACETHVRKDWNMNEIILEVEDYNTKGLEFYQKAGFDVLFSDPASRRYDINSSLWLKKVRCRREIMRKVYNNRQLNLMESADNLLRMLRETVENF